MGACGRGLGCGGTTGSGGSGCPWVGGGKPWVGGIDPCVGGGGYG